MSQDYYEREHRSSRRSSQEGRSGSGRSSSRREYDEERQEEGRSPSRRPRKKRRSAGRTVALVLLYVTAVIGVSILLACVGWVAAEDVLALNKPYKEVTKVFSEFELAVVGVNLLSVIPHV